MESGGMGYLWRPFQWFVKRSRLGIRAKLFSEIIVEPKGKNQTSVTNMASLNAKWSKRPTKRDHGVTVGWKSSPLLGPSEFGKGNHQHHNLPEMI